LSEKFVPQTINIEDFKWRLAETIAWFNNLESLRTSYLCPPWYVPKSHGLSLHDNFYNLSLAQRISDVEELAQKRSQSLKYLKIYPEESAKNLSGSKLFCYYTDGNLSDGAAEFASKYFLDGENAPPWDTWLYYVPESACWNKYLERHEWGPYLIAWIPPKFIERTELGVDANPESCISWASTVDSPFTEQLRDAGFIK
jgi:hypothetical protein